MTTNNQTILRPPLAATYVGLSMSTLAKQRLRGDGPSLSAFRRARLVTCRLISTSG